MSRLGFRKKKGQPYMREYSNIIRVLSKNSFKTIKEDAVMNCKDKLTRTMLVVTCRNRQRQLQAAWNQWKVNALCADIHDYKKDMISIMSRPIEDDEKRTELEIEVLMKWVMHTYHADPTGVQTTLYMCNSKKVIVAALNHSRMERYQCPEHIVLQNQSAGPDEGLYTIVNGKVDILIFSPDSMNLIRLETARKAKLDEEISQILKFGTRVAQLGPNSGFGELSAIANVRRGASVCAAKNVNDCGTDVFVVTKSCLIDLLAKQYSAKPIKEGEETEEAPSASAEVMDYLRQSGLAHKTSITDLLQAAACFKKISCESGTVLYRKGDPVTKVFIVLSGEFLLDTGDYDESKNHTGLPFQSLEHSKCYILRRGSILGDEGMVGKNKVYQASAMSLAEDNIIFEISSFGLSFLAKRFGLEKFSALAMKEQSPSNNDLTTVLKSEVAIHSCFTSLRKCIATQNPSRGFHPSHNGRKESEDDDQLKSSTSSLSCFPPLSPSSTNTTKKHSSTSKINNVASNSSSFSPDSKKSKGGSRSSTSSKKKSSNPGSSTRRGKGGDNKKGAGTGARVGEVVRSGLLLHDYPRLPRAAMHHAKTIVKQVQIRELSVIRNDARIHVEEADQEMRLIKAGNKKIPSAADKQKKEELEDKYQRAVGIYKNYISGGKKSSTLQRLCSENNVPIDNSEIDNLIDPAMSESTDISSTGVLNTMISFDDLEKEDDLFSSDEDELISYGMNPTVSKIEHYLFYLNLKKKKIARALNMSDPPPGQSSPDRREKRRSGEMMSDILTPPRRGSRVLAASFSSSSLLALEKNEEECRGDAETQPNKGIKRAGRAPRCSMDSPLHIPFQTPPPQNDVEGEDSPPTTPSPKPQRRRLLESKESFEVIPSRHAKAIRSVKPRKRSSVDTAPPPHKDADADANAESSFERRLTEKPSPFNRAGSAPPILEGQAGVDPHPSSPPSSRPPTPPLSRRPSAQDSPAVSEEEKKEVDAPEQKQVGKGKKHSKKKDSPPPPKSKAPFSRSVSSKKLTAAALKELGNEPLNPVKVPNTDSKQKKEKDNFLRMTTVYTVGVETVIITDKEGNSRRVFSKQQNINKPNFGGGGVGGVASAFESMNSSIASDLSFTKANPKEGLEIPPVRSIEKIFGISADTDSPVVNPKKYVPEHLWITRYMKSSNSSEPDRAVDPRIVAEISDDDFDSYKSDKSELSYSRSLVLRARQELAASLASAPMDHTDSDKEAALTRQRGGNEEEASPPTIASIAAIHASAVVAPIQSLPEPHGSKRKKSQWHIIAQDPLAAAAEHKVKEEIKGDVLHSFEMLMKEERNSTSYNDGRRKNITQSEFRFNRDVDKLNTVDEITSLNKVSQSSKDLLLWKKFCSERVVSVNKGHELKQIPIRSKTGFHTIYWGKLLIEKTSDA